MRKQAARQQARARVRQLRARVREDQAKRERRLARLGEQVAVAVAEREAVVADCEQRAGRALRSLVKEGLSAAGGAGVVRRRGADVTGGVPADP
jgi:hypothetical protein